MRRLSITEFMFIYVLMEDLQSREVMKNTLKEGVEYPKKYSVHRETAIVGQLRLVWLESCGNDFRSEMKDHVHELRNLGLSTVFKEKWKILYRKTVTYLNFRK